MTSKAQNVRMDRSKFSITSTCPKLCTVTVHSAFDAVPTARLLKQYVLISVCMTTTILDILQPPCWYCHVTDILLRADTLAIFYYDCSSELVPLPSGIAKCALVPYCRIPAEAVRHSGISCLHTIGHTTPLVYCFSTTV